MTKNLKQLVARSKFVLLPCSPAVCYITGMFNVSSLADAQGSYPWFLNANSAPGLVVMEARFPNELISYGTDESTAT
jgi:hypothetical protein